MNIIKYSNYDYAKWNNYCFDNSLFWKSRYWINYYKNSKFDVNFNDYSFFLEQNRKIIDVVPLIQEKDELYSPGFSDKKEILQEIKRIALENDIKRIQVDSDIKSYLNISGYTNILDLHKEIIPTKGCKSNIKTGRKYLTYEKCVNIEKFKSDYFRIAGKKTRPDKTFKLLRNWIQKGYGFLLEAQYKDKTAGYIYILTYKKSAYYFMAATFEEYKQYNVNHFLLWEAFKTLKNRGIEKIDLGEQVFNTLHYQPIEKEFNISKFKKGFGGELIQQPKSEYFFDQEYFKQTMEIRIQKYIENEYRNHI